MLLSTRTLISGLMRRSLCSSSTVDDSSALVDHRVIGQSQELFYFHEYAPGSAFFLPHGTRILQRLTQLLRSHYQRRGYDEVVTPIFFNRQLWKQSGHWDFYKENMFGVYAPHHTTAAHEEQHQQHSTEDHHDQHQHHHHHHYHSDSTSEILEKTDQLELKPMNCPSHCLIFKSRTRSHRELPIRYADFGMLHRNELAGALTGLTRVRRFQQDDAHIFCSEEQVEDEIAGCLDMMKSVYELLGLDYSFELSTRPEQRMGSDEQWDQAEGALRSALQSTEHEWTVNEGDGAFYGPKIDVRVRDRQQRSHQLATVQLDFQLPIRFGLQFQGEDEHLHTPVIVHRAVLGSLERCLALLIEHTAGKWPFWLSPRQAAVMPISEAQTGYAQKVLRLLNNHGFYAELDDSPVTLQRRIRKAEVSQFNYILIVGKQEEAASTVSVREKGSSSTTIIPLSQIPEFMQSKNPRFHPSDDI